MSYVPAAIRRTIAASRQRFALVLVGIGLVVTVAWCALLVHLAFLVTRQIVYGLKEMVADVAASG